MRNDENLMTEAAKGDMEAFEMLVERYHHSAFNVACRMLSDRHLAADAAQEAFLRVLSSAERYQPTAKFSTYFFSILRRICIDHYRKKKAGHLPDPDDHETKSGSEEPQDILIKNERLQSLHEAIELLPPRQRMALILKHFEDLSYKEIAQVMGCSSSAVDSLLVRARDKLKTLLEF